MIIRVIVSISFCFIETVSFVDLNYRIFQQFYFKRNRFVDNSYSILIAGVESFQNFYNFFTKIFHFF
ncbi:hypothetical protein FF021_09295 [Leptospira noguchii]|nr:hypothetical protein FF021_09295 [Leptospira noguchii]